MVCLDGFSQRSDIGLCLTPRFIKEAVSNQRHAAALLFAEQLHADAHRVKHANQIEPQLWVVVVHVTAVKERHLFSILRLLRGDPLIAATEAAEGVFWQAAAMVDFQRGVQQLAYRLQAGGGVDDGRKRRGKRTHQIGMAENRIAQAGFLLAIVGARALDNIADFHIGRAGHFAALAVDAVLERFIVQRAVFTPQAFAIWPRLFWPRIARVDAAHRADGGAHGTFDAVFKTLLVHASPPARPMICLAACRAVAAQTPPPQPWAIGS